MEFWDEQQVWTVFLLEKDFLTDHCNLNEVDDWLDNNCPSFDSSDRVWDDQLNIDGREYYFEHQADAAWFQIVWDKYTVKTP